MSSGPALAALAARAGDGSRAGQTQDWVLQLSLSLPLPLSLCLRKSTLQRSSCISGSTTLHDQLNSASPCHALQYRDSFSSHIRRNTGESFIHLILHMHNPRSVRPLHRIAPPLSSVLDRRLWGHVGELGRCRPPAPLIRSVTGPPRRSCTGIPSDR